MFSDARDLPSGTEIGCDLCIVGAGFAGIAIANRLRDSRLSILLIESGGFDPELSTQRLYRGETEGHSYYRLDACRWRLFGGGSNRWGGWCRPLDAMDFKRRDWVPYSGWPIDAEALKPFEAEAAQLFELPNARFDLETWRGRLPAPLGLDGCEFENAVFQHSPETSFGDHSRARLLTASNVTTLIHANLMEMRLYPHSQQVATLRIGSLTGKRFAVRPRATVLAAGGIENARLLLASRADCPAGLGNEFDVVGRYFIEHLHGPVGHLLAAPDSGDNRFYRKAVFEDVRLRGVLTPNAAAQEQHRLLAISIAFEPASYHLGTPFLGWPPLVTHVPIRVYRVLRQGQFNRAAVALKQSAQVAYSMPKRIASWVLSRRAKLQAIGKIPTDRVYTVYFRGEQAPNPANRVMLSERRDALGLPESRLKWSITPQDSASIGSWLALLDTAVRARGLGRVIGPSQHWMSRIEGGPHHMGTTRMSADPHHGVVDADCRVHSVDNLYVAGSSVFPTGGYANPTFTLVALALRLADTLRDRL